MVINDVVPYVGDDTLINGSINLKTLSYRITMTTSLSIILLTAL